MQDDPERVDRVVEETLRLATPTQGMFRIVTKATTLGGVDLPAGTRLVVVYASANRDESLFVDPDAFRPDRDNLKEHLAFGKGIHFCLGAALSRLEGRVALQEIVKRVESIRLTRRQRAALLPELHAPRPDEPERRADTAPGRLIQRRLTGTSST